LYDYRARNDGPIEIALDQHVVRVDKMRLGGEGTLLELAGTINLRDERIAMTAAGEANLGLLQAFFRDISSAGGAQLIAEIYGPMRTPQFAGSATILDGRIRHFSLPHSLEAINGRLSFDAGGIRVDDVTARLGGGEVRLGGRVGFKGYLPSDLSLTAVGEQMRVRYPEGFRSVIDADLGLRGDLSTPVLTGTVTVRDAVWSRRFEGDLLAFGGGESGPPAAASETAFPLQFDIRIVAPGTLRIENNRARIVADAELTLRGTYDRPLLFGRADIQRGEVIFEGNRYLVTRGSIDFTNPTRIEPFFDVEAETRVRVPGQTYRVVFHAVGTAEQFVPDISSDPPLPTVEILSLLFGDVRDPRDAELRTWQAPDAAEQELIKARAARLLASPITSEVGRVVERTLGVDTVVITPSLGDPTTQQQSARLAPTARLTLGKRISSRVYLTFSRSLTSSTRDQILLFEYDQTDRVSWIVSQNEDQTYAFDFRVRHIF
jgi:autotransporter translocation and assembly factor TamB